MPDQAVQAPTTQRALAWVEEVLSGAVPSCVRVRQACQRFRKDLERAGTDQFPFVFDLEASEHMCAFIEALPHIEGAWAARGETIRLIGWQAFLISQIAGWRHMVTGLRRYVITTPGARDIRQSADRNTVQAEQVQTVVVQDIPAWLILAFAVALFLDSPLRWPGQIRKAWRR